jgi:hypothetical protein
MTERAVLDQLAEEHVGTIDERMRRRRVQRNALAARAFPKDARVRQGAMVENKLLGHTVTLIHAYEQERDANTLRTARLTLRDEDLMRKSMGEVGLPNGRRRPKPRTYRAPILTATVNSNVDPLATVLAWAKQQAPG